MLYNTSISGSTVPPVTRIFVPINDNGPPAGVFAIGGHTLARRLGGLTAAQRAAMAVTNVKANLLLKAPTNIQVAALFGVSIPTLNKAYDLPPAECARVLRGERPLVGPHDLMKKVVGKIHSDADVEQFVTEVGLERTLNALDRLTAPRQAAG